VGAGVGRTGTESLKLALERLLGGRCYHMLEVIAHPEAFGFWARAAQDDMPDWDEVFDGYVACVDWPAAAFWPEISAQYPDALVLLSVRNSAEEWYRSASETIFAITPEQMPGAGAAGAAFFEMMAKRFTADLKDPMKAMATYEAHNQQVRDRVPADRLLEWRPGDGWRPICAALGVDEPDGPFPHVNTTEMFQARRREGFGPPLRRSE
jgi:Sulfotransferase domain